MPIVPATRFSRPRFALLVLLGVYPAITSLLYGVSAFTEAWSIWQRTLLVAPLMVAVVVWVVTPLVQKYCHPFINPRA